MLLGTSVLTPTFRYHPAVIAQAFATLGVLFPGRVMLGVGTGEAMNEVAVTGIEWPEYKERFARLREAIAADPRAVDRRARDVRGRLYRTARPRSTTARTRRCRSTSPPAARRSRATPAARATASSAPAEGHGALHRQAPPAVAEGLEKAGAPADAIDRMIEIKLSYDPDPAAALENTRFWAPLALTAEQKGGLEDPLEMQRAGDALPIEQVASRWIVASDPDEAVAQVKPYVDAGLNHLVFHSPGEDQERFFSAFEEQVMPRPLGALAQQVEEVRPRVGAARRRLEVVVVTVVIVAVVGQRQPAAPHADDDREHDRDVGARHAGEEERRDAPLGRDRVGLDDRDGARERHPGRGGEREVLEPLAVLELAEREPLVLVLAALARFSARSRAGSAPRISHGSPPPRRSTTLR